MFRCGWLTITALLVSYAALGADAGALANASMNGDVNLMHALLTRGADPNARGWFGTPALHWRVHADDVEESKRLLKAGADPNGLTERGVSPLSIAIGNGNSGIVGLL